MKNILAEIGTDLLVGLPALVLMVLVGFAIYVNHSLVFGLIALFLGWLLGAQIRYAWSRRFNTKG